MEYKGNFYIACMTYKKLIVIITASLFLIFPNLMRKKNALKKQVGQFLNLIWLLTKQFLDLLRKDITNYLSQ